jgi:hypothetical protein
MGSCWFLHSQNGDGSGSSFSIEVGISEQQAAIGLKQAAHG